MYLRQPAIAQIVVGSILKGVELAHFELGAYVIMPNHVHLLILPKIAPYRLVKSLKGATAREANKLLRRTGKPFWQKESYDHWVRDRAEFGRVRAYIESNPVNAGLARTPDEFPWSSAGVGKSADACTHECVRHPLGPILLRNGPRPRSPPKSLRSGIAAPTLFRNSLEKNDRLPPPTVWRSIPYRDEGRHGGRFGGRPQSVP